MQGANKLFDPTFLNIEFFFNQILEALKSLSKIVSNIVNLYVAPWITQIFLILAFIFFVAIIFLLIKTKKIRRNEQKNLENFVAEVAGSKIEGNERWEVVLNHLDSQNPSDWRMAILEADNILDDMVKKMGYDGENLGERLKAVEVSDFNSLQNAWEAHKIRNKIAHSGAGFDLTKREANRVIQLYERVFREFEFI